MKRKIILVFLLIMFLVFAGCQKADIPGKEPNPAPPSQEETPDTDNNGNNDGDNQGDNNNSDNEGDNKGESENQEKGGLFSIIKQIYEIKNPELMLGDITVDLNDKDSVKYYTGIEDISKIKDIAVSETMIGSQAYSLVLVQTLKSEDAKSAAEEMIKGIDQRKWICVEADDMKVVAQDDVIMLFMVSSAMEDSVTSEEMVNAFKEVRGGIIYSISAVF